MRFTTASLILSILAFTAAIASETALAQGSGKAHTQSSGDDSRSFLVSLPLSPFGETLGHMEFNLGGQGTIGLEGGVQRREETIPEKEQLLTGEPLVTSARTIGIMVGRYTEPMAMGGFYWALGVGYREQDVKWSVKPADNDKGVNLNLVDDKTGRLNHDATMKGTSGAARVGYRFVGTDFPVVLGIYIGARHFQSTVRDVERKAADGSADAVNGEDSRTHSNLTELEKERLKRGFMTSPQAAIEVGAVF